MNILESKFFDYRLDHDPAKLGRGLIVYSKRDIKHINTFRKDINGRVLEMIELEIPLFDTTLHILNVYVSPNFPSFALKETVQRKAKEYKEDSNVLIMGDFNTGKDLFKEHGYKQVISVSTSADRFGGKLCHAYTKVLDFSITGHCLFKSFTRSTHHPIAVELKRKKEASSCVAELETSSEGGPNSILKERELGMKVLTEMVMTSINPTLRTKVSDIF